MASVDIPIGKPLIQICDDNDDDDAESNETRFIYMLNAILSGTARLNVLLPTATILGFTIFAPLATNDGSCGTLNRWLTAIFLGFCVLSCAFFTLMDSYRTVSGRICYGVATIHGIWSLSGGRRKPADPSAYRLRLSDLFHVTLSIVAFLAFASSHNDVAACYYKAMPRKVTNVVPLVFGFVISLLLVMFPSKRKGIGYPFLLRADALHIRA
ncbi:protein DMP6-like [Nymphaea colorata]|uniref:Uncharacterized protein n=1 Tax=Nymphaea colorata TaxID=210225 RepID=A0A5K0XBY7_9MAGN|nr:protein DMP6-like [Nymphaea colorata]